MSTRCAIYTRKSSEEGLDQAFNSLDAQREACEAYAISQKGEGWTALPARYDDGGWSGGNMERPALRRLLADIDAGLIDVVIVYKVDRLTRSLGDFARIVELFDRHGVSFVSVTQAFNTTSSMGRLTLNVLLSFAQFEREVTGERIRDKIAASKAKGMWMGGLPPLGYDPRDRTLVVNPAEAEIVQSIFMRYLELGSINAVMRALDADGVRSKRHISKNGAVRGGVAYSRGALFHLLRNRLYIGEIVHKDLCHPGQHEPIIDRVLFDAVAEQLVANGSKRSGRTQSRAPLTSRLFDSTGNRMTPAHAKGRSGRRYLYYVSAPLQQGNSIDGSSIGRIAASALEPLVLDALRRWSGHSVADWSSFQQALTRIELHRDTIVLTVVPPDHENWIGRVCPPESVTHVKTGLRIIMPVALRARSARTELHTNGSTAIRSRRDRPMIAALQRAHVELERCGIDLLDRAPKLDRATGLADPYLRKLIRLAFLAPDIQRAILEGRQPPGLALGTMLASVVPLGWSEQRQLFGFAEA